MELLLVAIGMIVLASFDIMANGMGVDSRDFSDDPYRRSSQIGIV